MKKKAVKKKAAAKKTVVKKAVAPKKKVAKKATAAKKAASKASSSGGAGNGDGVKKIDAKIKQLSDWRGETLSHMRALIKDADPQVTEEMKWGDVPVWEHDGIICTGETYKAVVKLTFAKGASLKDPAKLFNSSLEGNTRRAIDIREGEKINEKAFKELIRAAVTLNGSKKKKSS